MSRSKSITSVLALTLFVLFILLFAGSVQAKRLYKERVYQDIWCDQMRGDSEVRLSDGTRADCLMGHYAVEVDFADKWAESVGQSLHYSSMTGLMPGILLILEDNDRDAKYLQRLRDTIDIQCLKIRVWLIRPDAVRQELEEQAF